MQIEPNENASKRMESSVCIIPFANDGKPRDAGGFSCGNEIVGTTLTSTQVQGGTIRDLIGGSAHDDPRDIEIGSERFLATSLVLSGSRSAPVRLSVLGSYDQATKFVDQLNRYL